MVIEEEEELPSLTYLKELQEQATTVKVEVEYLKDFKAKLKEVLATEELISSLLVKYTVEGDLVVTDKNTLMLLLDARKQLRSHNVRSDCFCLFKSKLLPMLNWLNRANKLIKLYSKAIGLKAS